MIPRDLRPEPRMARAVCPEVDPELFFPEDNSITSLGAPVRVLCRSCEVRLECLTYALDHHEAGVWGGFTEAARTRIVTQRNRGRRLEDIIAEDNEAWFAYVEAQQEAAARERQQAKDRRRERAQQLGRAA